MNLTKAEFCSITELDNVCTNKGRPIINIPYYQRPYEWGEENIRLLVSDYNKNAKKKNSTRDYFIGATVIVQKQKQVLEIVDGQQRITTMYLLHYLKYVLLRALVESDLKSSSQIGQVSNDLESLKRAYQKLIGNKKIKSIEKMIESVNTSVSMINSANYDNEKKDKELQKALKKYRDTLGITSLDNKEKNYYDDYVRIQESFWEGESLSLTYSRNNFNKQLIKALARINCYLDENGSPCFDISFDEKRLEKLKKDDEIVWQYAFASKSEYETIKTEIEKNYNGRNLTIELIKQLDELVSNIKFCAIVTDDEKDAYALFESLNDRSKTVDDIDLIKNQYYMAYYNTSKDKKADLEKGLEKIDNTWNNDIFPSSNDISNLISLLGAVYLTGDTSIDDKNGIRVRKNISEYLESQKKYTLSDAVDDISIYKMASMILEATKADTFTKELLVVENNPNSSIIVKCLYLIRALKYNNVLTGLVNVIIGYYLKYHCASEIEGFKDYLDDLFKKNNEDNYKEISQIAYDMWRTIIQSHNYENPRKYATILINACHKGAFQLSNTKLSSDLNDSSKAEFKEWLQEWRHKSTNKQNIKLKVMFFRLLQSGRDEEKKEIILAGTTKLVLTKPEGTDLDHLEPVNPDNTNPNSYFKANKRKGEIREDIINGLGNMMILDDKNNIRKSHGPVYKSMDYYKNMFDGAPHWLVLDIEKSLSNSSHFNTITKAPKVDFFYTRRNILINYFEAIMSASTYDTKKVNY